ncbi:hypothetical protein DF186_18895, partial [Enterococcus hirae]
NAFSNPDSDGIRYLINGELRSALGSSPGSSVLRFENITLGDKNLKKMWRRIYVYTNSDYSGTPTVTTDFYYENGGNDFDTTTASD